MDNIDDIYKKYKDKNQSKSFDWAEPNDFHLERHFIITYFEIIQSQRLNFLQKMAAKLFNIKEEKTFVIKGTLSMLNNDVVLKNEIIQTTDGYYLLIEDARSLNQVYFTQIYATATYPNIHLQNSIVGSWMALEKQTQNP